MHASLELKKKIINVRNVDKTASERLSVELGVPPVVAQLLVIRGLESAAACKAFLKPELSQFHNPFLFPDMEKAVIRIMAAVEKKEPVAVYGDYDVDGITATAILFKTLRRLGADCVYHLPNRITEGYGVSEDSIRKLAESGTRLIITVDCGISSCHEAQIARSLGVDLIITDHHEPKQSLPEACAILNPKCASDYPDKSLAGVGVALKLCHALAIKNKNPDEVWTDHLDCAAVGTAADIVPMIGENRIIAKLGFEKLKRTGNAGLKALIAEQGLAGKPLSTSEVGFLIAPCINAVGRLGDARKGVELLLTEDNVTATRIARELKEANLERRAIDKSMQEEAFSWVDTFWDPEKDYAIVIARPNWHCGVVGIVASKVAERYHRPTLLFSINEEGLARGSGRSIPGLHLQKALTECGDLLVSFGGHAAAAGMTILTGNIERFSKRFNEVVKAHVSVDDLIPHISADVALTLSDCSYSLFNWLKQMEPFGPGNPQPLFLCRDLKNKFEPRVVGQKHLKMMVAEKETAMDAIGFNLGHYFENVKKSRAIALVFSLDENEWNGRKCLQLKVKGVEP
jgi:single-stranded-DNA-specific exonuclease